MAQEIAQSHRRRTWHGVRHGASPATASLSPLRTSHSPAPAHNRLTQAAQDAVLPRCGELDFGVLAREPLANGYLGGKYRPGTRVTDAGDRRSTHDPSEVDRQLEAVARIAAEEVPKGAALSQWAIAWCPRNPAVSAVIPGARNLRQLDSNIGAAEPVSDAHPQVVGG